jgi:hypothetical protein
LEVQTGVLFDMDKASKRKHLLTSFPPRRVDDIAEETSDSQAAAATFVYEWINEASRIESARCAISFDRCS